MIVKTTGERVGTAPLDQPWVSGITDPAPATHSQGTAMLGHIVTVLPMGHGRNVSGTSALDSTAGHSPCEGPTVVPAGTPEGTTSVHLPELRMCQAHAGL